AEVDDLPDIRRCRPRAVRTAHDILAGSRYLLRRHTKSRNVDAEVPTPRDQPLFGIEPDVPDLAAADAALLPIRAELPEDVPSRHSERPTSAIKEKQRALSPTRRRP